MIRKVIDKGWHVTDTHLPSTPSLVLFALGPAGPLGDGVINLHTIAWKFIIIHFTQADEGKRFDPDQIWKDTIRRLISRVERWRVALRMRHAIAKGKGQKCSFDKEDAHLRPWAHVSEDGIIRYSDEMWNEIKRLELAHFSH